VNWLKDGSVGHDIEVCARRRAYGGICGPEVNWSATGSTSAAGARRYAGMIVLAAELADGGTVSDYRITIEKLDGPAGRPVTRKVCETGGQDISGALREVASELDGFDETPVDWRERV
jgi:hypothetical protein